MRTTYSIVMASIILLHLAPSIVQASVFEGYGLEPAAIVISGADIGEYRQIREMIENSGARGLQFFPPEAVFGYFPPDIERLFSDRPEISIERSASAVAGSGVDRITASVIEALLQANAGRMDEVLPSPDNRGGGPYRLPGPGEGVFARSAPLDEAIVMRTLSAEQSARLDGLSSSRGPEGSPGEIAERAINQNSEFLIGSVLINIVFPQGMTGDENWEDAEFEAAIRDISDAITRIQQLAHWVPLSFHYNYRDFKRIPVTSDLIDTNAFDGTETVIIWEVLDALGYDVDFGSTMIALHNFNCDTREHFGTDWVFTVFVADQSTHHDPTPVYPDPACWGGAGYTLNSVQGGPYMAIPYPACWYGTGRVFSNLFTVGLFRIFWGQYESDFSAAHCEPEFGYLSVPNLNSLHIYLGQTEPCGFGEDCIMHTPALPDPMPVCRYTAGQIGLADVNDNSVADVYEVYPELETVYVPGFNPDTTFDGTYMIGLIARNEARPNMNPAQPALTRINYAPWLVKGMIQINSDLAEPLIPGDGKWDESCENLSCILEEGLEPGDNTLTFRVENCVGLVASTSIEVTYIGMKFYSLGIDSYPEGMEISWGTSDQVFGSDFELMREDLSCPGSPECITTLGSDDYSEGGAHRRVYRYYDDSIMLGHLYKYWIVSRFEVYHDGVLEEFVYESGELVERAMIPVAKGIISSIVPNPLGPSTDQLIFTVDIPETYYNPSGSAQPPGGEMLRVPAAIEIKTELDISVYNVNGQKVRKLFDLPVYGGYMTRTWDGTDSSGRRLAPGIYFLRVRAGDREEVRKIILL